MATVYWKEVETSIKRWKEDESIFNLVNGVHDAGAEALIRRVEQAKEILEDFVVNDGGHYMTAARLIRRGKAVLWLKALKEEPDSVG